MSKQLETTVTVCDDEDEYEVNVSYCFTPGTPEMGRGYMADPYKYDPGSPDLIEDIKVLSVDGTPADRLSAGFAAVMEKMVEDNADAIQQMINAAHEAAEIDHYERADAMMEARSALSKVEG